MLFLGGIFLGKIFLNKNMFGPNISRWHINPFVHISSYKIMYTIMYAIMKRPIRANYITKYIMVSKWLPPINKEGFPLVAWRRLTTIYFSYSWLKTSISEGSIHRIFGFLSKKSAFYFTPPGDPSRIQSHLSTYSNTVRHPSVDGLFIPPKYNSLDTPSWLKTQPMQSQISTESNAFLIYVYHTLPV